MSSKVIPTWEKLNQLMLQEYIAASCRLIKIRRWGGGENRCETNVPDFSSAMDHRPLEKLSITCQAVPPYIPIPRPGRAMPSSVVKSTEYVHMAGSVDSPIGDPYQHLGPIFNSLPSGLSFDELKEVITLVKNYNDVFSCDE